VRTRSAADPDDSRARQRADQVPQVRRQSPATVVKHVRLPDFAEILNPHKVDSNPSEGARGRAKRRVRRGFRGRHRPGGSGGGVRGVPAGRDSSEIPGSVSPSHGSSSSCMAGGSGSRARLAWARRSRSPFRCVVANELILIVEDNPKNLKLVRDTLQVMGYHPVEAETGEEGVRLAHERHPALILMDIQLPGISGIEALQRLRAGSRDKPHPGHRHHGLGDDARPNANHGRWLRRLPGQADQRQATSGNGARNPRQAMNPVVRDEYRRRRGQCDSARVYWISQGMLPTRGTAPCKYTVI